MRVIVAQPCTLDGEPSARIEVPVGVLLRKGPAPALDVIVKVTFACAAAAGPDGLVTAAPAPVQEPLTPDDFEPGDPIALDEPIEMGRIVRLPDLAPRAALDLGDEAPIPVPLACDGRRVDAERGLVSLVWRGRVPWPPGFAARVDWLAVSLERDVAPRDDPAIRRALARGAFAPAIHREDLPGGPPPHEIEAARLMRYATWEDATPAPALDLPRYAEIAAEIAEGREPRGDALSRHGLDEDAWLLEEQAWLLQMGDAAMEGDETLADRYGALFVEAQDRLEEPGETPQSIEAYAAIAVALERADDPAAALNERAMTLPEWLRLDRRWTRRANADPEIAGALSRALDAAREGGDGR